MQDQKWFVLSKRIVGIVLVVVGAVLPMFGIDAETNMPALTGALNSGMATAGAVLLLVHALRSRKEKVSAPKIAFTVTPPK